MIDKYDNLKVSLEEDRNLNYVPWKERRDKFDEKKSKPFNSDLWKKDKQTNVMTFKKGPQFYVEFSPTGYPLDKNCFLNMKRSPNVRSYTRAIDYITSLSLYLLGDWRHEVEEAKQIGRIYELFRFNQKKFGFIISWKGIGFSYD